ncbi:MAG: aminotransferase class V-fold PLP-dependent enzyme [Maribacter sp.]|uniref:pyridoxal phosphate-dependent decarboxylase family protein n=1 Tax=Maribacter sp. TaxID=1897614 RepID=UPI003299E14D
MTKNRTSPLEIGTQKFKENGYNLIDSIAAFNASIASRPVTTAESPEQIRSLITERELPENGTPVSDLISKTTAQLFDHSLFNGHPKFMGYITASPAPMGILGDLLASATNPNVGAYILSPVATEIEKQTIQWLCEFIGVPSSYGGIFVSGGNMANFTAFLAARTAKAPKNFKEEGLLNSSKKLIVYCSKTTHTWIEKAAILFGHGSNSVRWIATDGNNKMEIGALETAIRQDVKDGHQPFMVAGTAGDVSTGTVDNLEAVATICKTYDLWFHIDGAYGVPAAIVPEIKQMFRGIEKADSIAIDPHKWLYSPLEAGCTLVKNPKHLVDTYSSHPEYYNFGNANDEQNFYEYGLQNSRGFRALKVWLMLQQVGRNGYAQMIKEDVELSRLLFNLARKHPELEGVTQNLSITTLRYVPKDIPSKIEDLESYLNTLNEMLDNTLQASGQVFMSNAIVNSKYCLRSCIVNFRTSKKDIEEIVALIVQTGKELHKNLVQTHKNK